MVSESVIVLVSRADTVQEKSLKNLESQEYWILNNPLFQAISNFWGMRNNSDHFPDWEFYRIALYIPGNCNKQDDSGKIEILILILSVFLFI